MGRFNDSRGGHRCDSCSDLLDKDIVNIGNRFFCDPVCAADHWTSIKYRDIDEAVDEAAKAIGWIPSLN